nr:uncharacterized protein LOC129268097 [Lytechinus pictus]
MLTFNVFILTRLPQSFLGSRIFGRCSSELIETSWKSFERTPKTIRQALLTPQRNFQVYRFLQSNRSPTKANDKMRSNVEIKARVTNPDHLRALAKDFADEQETDVMKQVDTFFNCGKGRLKLREIINHPTRPSKLVAYIRSDQEGPKESKYSITEVDDAESLKQTLGMALGVRGVVKKTRTLMMIGQTRLHIDEVEGLGNFMELEVVLEEDQTQEEGIKIAQDLMEKLSIHQSDLISGAYMDLLES